MLSLLTYNIFTGSPVPLLCNGTRALHGSVRLAEQLEGVALLDADMMCLQELYCDGVHARYVEYFDPVYGCAPLSVSTRAAARIAGAMLIVCGGAIFYGMLCVFMSPPVWMVVLCYLLAELCFRRAAAASFFLGRTACALMFLYKRSRITLVSSKTVLFTHQAGDWMNYFRPRGMQVLHVRVRATGAELHVINVHLNALGGQADRAAQFREVLTEMRTHAPVATIVCGDFNCELARVDGFAGTELVDSGAGTEDTWSSENALARGYFRIAGHRCDYVLHARGEGVMYDTVCRVVLRLQPPVSDHYGVLFQWSQRVGVAPHVAPPGSFRVEMRTAVEPV